MYIKEELKTKLIVPHLTTKLQTINFINNKIKLLTRIN